MNSALWHSWNTRYNKIKNAKCISLRVDKNRDTFWPYILTMDILKLFGQKNPDINVQSLWIFDHMVSLCTFVHKKNNVQIYSAVLGSGISILEEDMLGHCWSFRSTRKTLSVSVIIRAKIGIIFWNFFVVSFFLMHVWLFWPYKSITQQWKIWQSPVQNLHNKVI